MYRGSGPDLDKRQLKTKRRLSTLYALLVLVIAVIAALLLSMKPLSSIDYERKSQNIAVYYFEGAIDTSGVALNDKQKLRINSFNDNKICVSVVRTAEGNEVSTKNFVLSWLFVNYPTLNINDDSIKFLSHKWTKSHEACDDAYMSNVFQYDKRQAQTDITMDNIVTNWRLSGLILFLGAINVIMVLWFISINRDEMAHYRDRR